jgi:transcriptional regulator with XRE-family HTH domain
MFIQPSVNAPAVISPQTDKRLMPSSIPRPPIRPIPLYQRTSMGPVLERVMEHSGTHQAEVARRMRIRPQSLNQYVKSRRARPSLDWLLHFLSVNGASLVVVFPANQSFVEVERATQLESEPESLPESLVSRELVSRGDE